MQSMFILLGKINSVIVSLVDSSTNAETYSKEDQKAKGNCLSLCSFKYTQIPLACSRCFSLANTL